MLDNLLINRSLWSILTTLIIFFILAFELGFYIGRHKRAIFNESSRSWVSTIEIAILSILGLLLAFTFVMAQNRFDLRQKLVIAEANSIGTTYLRADLLPNPQKTVIEKLLRQYLDLRIAAPKSHGKKLYAIIAKSEQIQARLWTQTLSIDMNKIHPAVFAIFINSLNQLISLHTDRVAAFTNRVPTLVLFVLFLCGILAVGATGYNSGLRNQRNFVPTSMLSLLLVLVFFMIIDLDRPLQGLIRTNQLSLIELQHNLEQMQKV